MAFYNIESGDSSSGLTIENGTITVIYGGTANNTTLNNSGTMFAYGSANSTTVNSGGQMKVYSDAMVKHTVANSSYLYVYGGNLEATSLNKAVAYISGGTISDSYVTSGTIQGFRCGFIISTTLATRGAVYRSSGARAIGSA